LNAIRREVGADTTGPIEQQCLFRSGCPEYLQEIELKKFMLGLAALAVLPGTLKAQDLSAFSPTPGAYVGIESGLNWLLTNGTYQSQTGYTVGGKIGYDFVGPRFELEGLYKNNMASGYVNVPGNTSYVNGQINQFALMTNALYDFTPGARFVPYLGAGIGIAFVDPSAAAGCSLCSTQFAYQAIGGVGYNASPNVRINLEARYYGTTSTNSYANNDLSVLMGVTYKFGAVR
jgi:OOP family OmpA-OmpF porin